MTRELLAAADSCSDPDDRRAVMHEAAVLNADVALAITSSLYRRYPHAASDEPALLAHVREVYLRAVADLPPGSATDLLTDMLPVLQAAVVAFGRATAPSR